MYFRISFILRVTVINQPQPQVLPYQELLLLSIIVIVLILYLTVGCHICSLLLWDSLVPIAICEPSRWQHLPTVISNLCRGQSPLSFSTILVLPSPEIPYHLGKCPPASPRSLIE